MASGSEKKVWSLSNFDTFKILGKGSFGIVYRAREKESTMEVAIKVLFKAQLNETGMFHQVRREIEIQQQLRHPNIAGLYGFFQDRSRIYIIMELAENGSLSTAIQSQPNKRFEEKQAAQYIKSVTSALMYLHGKKIIHRDLKLENILIGKNNELKFCDFGLSVQVGMELRNTFCGTAVCMAPEIIQNKGYDKRVDLWSLGVLCFELLTGTSPFSSNIKAEVFKKILNLDYEIPSYVSGTAKTLIQRLLVIEPGQRLSLEKVKNNPWILKNV